MDSEEYLTKVNIVDLVREIRNSPDITNSFPKKSFPYIETFYSPIADKPSVYSSSKTGNKFYYSDTLKFNKASFSLGRLFKGNITGGDSEKTSKKIIVRSSNGRRNLVTSTSKDVSNIKKEIFSNSFIQKVTPRFRKNININRSANFRTLITKNKPERQSPELLVNRIVNRTREQNRKNLPIDQIRKHRGKRLVIEIDCAQRLESSLTSLSSYMNK